MKLFWTGLVFPPVRDVLSVLEPTNYLDRSDKRVSLRPLGELRGGTPTEAAHMLVSRLQVWAMGSGVGPKRNTSCPRNPITCIFGGFEYFLCKAGVPGALLM